MKNQSKNGGRLWHLTAALLLLTSAFFYLEFRVNAVFFFITGILALMAGLTTSSFFNKPFTDALVLWLEAVCLLLVSLKAFSMKMEILPWLWLIGSVMFAIKGFKRAGIKLFA